MSSIINNQRANIEQLVAPLGVNLISGSPSLTPTLGALGYNLTNSSVCYSNGASWQTISAGAQGPQGPQGVQGPQGPQGPGAAISYTDNAPISVTLTASGQVNITGTLYLQKITGPNTTMVYFQLAINNFYTPTSVANPWTGNPLPNSSWYPANNSAFENPIPAGISTGAGNAYLLILTTGQVELQLFYTGVNSFFTIQGEYFV